MNNTHAAIRRLLERYRAEQDDYLHEGRNAPQPDIEAYARRFEAILAAEMHEATPETGIEVDVFPRKQGDFTAAVKDTTWTLNMMGDTAYLRDEWDEILIFDHELDIVIALLQRARALMMGGA